MWILFAFLSPIFHAFANILDSYFVNSIFKRVTTFTFFSSFLNLLFLPVVIIISLPQLPSFSLIPFFSILGLINVLYTIPYYRALQEVDTSVVTALFSVGNIFVPILAYILVGEVLTLIQYIGFFIIIFSSVYISIDCTTTFKVNKAFFYMLLVSILLSFETVIYKYILERIDWSTGFVWTVICSFLFASLFLLFKKTRIDIRDNIGIFKKKFSLFVFEEFLTFAGSAVAIIAISLAPVTLVKGIGETQSIFVVLYALVLGVVFPKLFKEKIDRKSIFKKIICFIIIIGGILLIS